MRALLYNQSPSPWYLGGDSRNSYDMGAVIRHAGLYLVTVHADNRAGVTVPDIGNPDPEAPPVAVENLAFDTVVISLKQHDISLDASLAGITGPVRKEVYLTPGEVKVEYSNASVLTKVVIDITPVQS